MTEKENGVLQTLTNEEFNMLSQCVQKKLGIKMPETKKPVLEARLQKRLRKTQIARFSEYCDFLFSEEGAEERIAFIDAVTTHKTFFFREAEHFKFLCEKVVSSPNSSHRQQNGEILHIWSAGCSTGEEPYSIAMELEEYKEKRAMKNLEYSILATDVSMETVKKAKKGIYDVGTMEGIPEALVHKYFLKSKDSTVKLKKIIPEIRQRLRFGVLNLNEDFYLETKVDAIFCRNVMIYFDEITKKRVIGRFIDSLKKGGYLFIGFSENMRGIDSRLQQVAPAVYKV